VPSSGYLEKHPEVVQIVPAAAFLCYAFSSTDVSVCGVSAMEASTIIAAFQIAKVVFAACHLA